MSACGRCFCRLPDRALLLIHQPYAEEDEDDGNALHRAKNTKAEADADDAGDDGLDVVVHRDNGGTKHLLRIHHEDVADERAAYDDEGRLEPGRERNVAPGKRCHMTEGEGRDDKGGPEHHPLHAGDGGIALDETAEDVEVDGKAELCADDHEIAREIALFERGAAGTTHDEDESTTDAEDDAHDLLPGEGLVHEHRGDDHGDDGHRGGHDAGMDGRGEREADGEVALVEHDAKETGAEKEEKVARCHVLVARLVHAEAGDPEAESRTAYAEGDHVDAREVRAVGPHGILAEWCHQSPDNTCQGDVEMPEEVNTLLLIH